MSAYSLTAEGYVYFTDGCTNVRMYLCGSRITRKGYTTIKAYYNSDVKLAVTVWDWYTTVCELVPPTDCTLSLPLDIVIGTKAWEGTAPWIMSAGTKHVRAYNPLYCNKLGIYWELLDDDGNEYTTGIPVTPAAVRSLVTQSKPVLKHQTPQEWAFKVGTLCTPNTPTPDWNALAEHRGHRWIAKACQPPLSSWTTTEDLDAYYQLGTLCKWGTPYSQVAINEGKLQLVGPDCTAIVNDEGAAPSEVPVTLLKGYSLKVKITGSKPSKPLTKWYKGCPTFNIINYYTEASLPLLYLLQDSGYISKLVSVDNGDGKVTLTDEGLYFNARPDADTPSALLMAYS